MREAEEPSGRVIDLSDLGGRGTGNRSTRPSLVLEHSHGQNVTWNTTDPNADGPNRRPGARGLSRHLHRQ